jgi:tetratricopeptide (TPR) repeat protein
MFARIRDKLQALELEASQDPAPPLAPPLTDVEGSGAKYAGAGAGAVAGAGTSAWKTRLELKRNKSGVTASEAEVTEADEALKDEILEILEGTTSTDDSRVVSAQQHIKAGNFEEAHDILQPVLQAAKVLPQALARVKLLLAYSRFKLGVIAKADQDFSSAAKWFTRALDRRSRPQYFREDHLSKLRKMRAYCFYEVGKKLQEDGYWVEARDLLVRAERTKCLPNAVKEKVKLRIDECSFRCPCEEENAANEDAPMTTETPSLRDWLTLISPKNAGLWLEKLAEEDCETVDNLLDADDNDRVELIESIADKILSRKRLFKAIGKAKGTKLYISGRKALHAGEYALAKKCFSDLLSLSDTDHICSKVERATKQIQIITDIESAPESVCIFDRASQGLLTLGLSTSSLGLTTQTITIQSTLNGRKGALLMYLEEEFPEGSLKRKKFLTQLYTDMCTALDVLRNRMRILDIDLGSVKVYFEFVEVYTDLEPDVPMLREEYLRQVQDQSSELWEGAITQNINREYTLKLTEQLEQKSSVDTVERLKHAVGDVVVLSPSSCHVECELVSLLGKGGNASVFRVNAKGKVCALKVFHAQDSLVNLCREALLLLSLNYPHCHPNVLRVEFVWYEQSTREAFFLMQHVDCGNLRQWMNNERLYTRDAEEQQGHLLQIAHGLARALAYLHSLDILHLDVKPENVLMTVQGSPVLADFSESSQGVRGEDGIIRAKMTGGTPAYASPNMRSIFFEARATPVAQRAKVLEARTVSQSDDTWCFAATVFSMFAEYGWAKGQSVADAVHSDESRCLAEATLRVAIPPELLALLYSCFGIPSTITLVMESVAEAIGHASMSSFAAPSLACGLEDKHCAIIRNNIGLALHHKGHKLQAQEQYRHALRAGSSVQTIKCCVYNSEGKPALIADVLTHKAQDRLWDTVQEQLEQVIGDSNHPIGCTIELAEGPLGHVLLIHIIRAAMWDEMSKTGLITDVGFLQVLRDQILTVEGGVSKFERGLNERLNEDAGASHDREGAEEDEDHETTTDASTLFTISVDKTHFAVMYEQQMLMLDSLTPHQAEALEECIGGMQRGIHIKAAAGSGKTFLAMYLMLRELLNDDAAHVIFVAQNTALAYFVAKWVYMRTREQHVDQVLIRVHMMHGPKLERAKVSIDTSTGRLILTSIGASQHIEYNLLIVDEAHHVYKAFPNFDNDFTRKYGSRALLHEPGASEFNKCLPNSHAIEHRTNPRSATKRLLLSDVSQSTTFHEQYPYMKVVVLNQIVRSSGRIVEGARVFVCNDDDVEPMRCHHPSAGPPLKVFLFDKAPSGSDGEEDHFWLHVDIRRCKALADTQFVIAQDPYVLIALPDGTSERTKCALGGGTDPEWDTSHDKHITLKLCRKQIPCALTIQVWNENDGYFESDDIIGHADATLQFEQLYITEEQLQQGARAKTVPLLANMCIFPLQARPGKKFH